MSAVEGQSSRLSVILRGTQSSRLVQCFSSHPDELQASVSLIRVRRYYTSTRLSDILLVAIATLINEKFLDQLVIVCFCLFCVAGLTV